MRGGTLELTAPLALDWVVVDFGQTVPRPDHDLIQLWMPETADHTLEGERDVEKEKKTGRRERERTKSFGTSTGNIQNAEENSDEKAFRM